MLPKCIPKTVGSVPFCHHFGDIFRKSVFLCIVAARWLPFWIPLAPFWLPMAIFRSPFGALWLTFAHLRALFYRRPGFSCNSPIKIQVVHSAVEETRLCRAKDKDKDKDKVKDKDIFRLFTYIIHIIYI